MLGNSSWGTSVVGAFLARRNWRLSSFAYLAAVAATGSLLWGTQPVSADATPSGFRYSGSAVEFVPFETIQADATDAGPTNFKYTGASAEFEARINVRDNLSPNLPFGAGGSLDSANQFPGVVLVEFFDPVSGGDFVCTGTLTNARTILVAAHCMRGLPVGLAANYQPHVYFGNNVLTDFLNFNSLRGTSHVANAGFDPNAFFLGNDIGVISLSTPVFATGTTRPGLRSGIPYTQLATTAPAIGTDVTLVGYGQAGTGSNPGSIFDLKRRIATNQVEYVGLISDLFISPPGTSNLIFTDFENPLDTFNTDLFGTEIVTANEGTSDNGDSGGPLFALIGGQLVQVGVTSGGASFGPLQGGYADLAFWTSVADFNTWLAANSPLQTVSSAAGNALWSSAAHWVGGVVPDNFDTPVGSIADFTSPTRYYNVNLAAAGITTLSDAREIDLLTVSGAAARLDVTNTGNLFVWSDAVMTNGTLRVDGTIDVAKLTLNGGRLQGTGNVISAVAAATNTAGTVAPGNSIGTLTITGNYVQGAGGILEIELTNGSSDKLVVTGNASLAGTVQFLPFGPLPLENQFYDFITTGGTVTGTFGTIQDLLPGSLFPVVTYGSNFARVTLRSLCTNASGPIETPTCNALNDPTVQADPDMIPAIGQLQALYISNPAGFGDVLEALNPTRASAQAVTGFALGDILREQLSRRSHDLLGGSADTGGDIAQLSLAGAQLASADPTAEMLASAAAAATAADGAEEAAKAAIKLPYGYGLHFAGDFAWTKTDQAGAIGEDEADVQALTAGIDYNDGKGSVMGAALSYLTAEVDQTYGFGGQTDSDGYALSIFGATQMGNVSADVYASFGWLAYDTTRRLMVAPATFANAIGETDSMQTQAGANFTAELAHLSSLRMSAIGGVHYIGLSIDGYTETGAGALSAVLPDREIASLKSLLGAQFDLRISDSDRIVPFFRVQWAHEFSDDGLATSAAFSGAPTVTFTSPGPELGDDWATLGAGFSGRLTPRTNVYIRYQGDFGRDGQDNHGISAAARIAF